jgi:hypothetical protein
VVAPRALCHIKSSLPPNYTCATTRMHENNLQSKPSLAHMKKKEKSHCLAQHRKELQISKCIIIARVQEILLANQLITHAKPLLTLHGPQRQGRLVAADHPVKENPRNTLRIVNATSRIALAF